MGHLDIHADTAWDLPEGEGSKQRVERALQAEGNSDRDPMSNDHSAAQRATCFWYSWWYGNIFLFMYVWLHNSSVFCIWPCSLAFSLRALWWKEMPSISFHVSGFPFCCSLNSYYQLNKELFLWVHLRTEGKLPSVRLLHSRIVYP